MKKITSIISLVAFVIVIFASMIETSFAATRVSGYTRRSTGTYVAPHYKSTRDTSRWNNYSTRGNYNPYTGKKGYTSPYKTYRSRW